MEFTKLLPKATSFYLANLEKEIYLKPCTLGTFAAMEKDIGDISAILSKPSLENLSKIAYYLMADKSIFAEEFIENYSMDGKLIKETFGGYKKLMLNITNVDEQVSILKAITESMGIEIDEKKTAEKVVEAQIQP